MNKFIENTLRRILFVFLLVIFSIIWGIFLHFGEISLFPSELGKSNNYGKSLSGLAYAQGGAKPFIFGPYVPLSPGKYRVTFTLKIANNKLSQPVAIVDVVAGQAQDKFISRTLRGTDFKSRRSYQDFDVQFETMLGAKDFEFRIGYIGGSKLWAEKVAVTQLRSYSKEEGEGANSIRGYTKDSVVTKNFLGGSRYKEMSIDNPKFSRRMGYAVSDSKASIGRAWLVKPRMAEMATVPTPVTPTPVTPTPVTPTPVTPKTEDTPKPVTLKVPKAPEVDRSPRIHWIPKIPELSKIPKLPKMPSVELWKRAKPWSLFVLGLIAGYLIALINAFIYRRISAARRLRRLKRTISSYSFGEIINYVFKYVLNKYSLLVALVAAIFLSVLSENLVLFSFILRGEYILIVYIILSFFWKMDYRISIILASVLIAGCSFFLTFGQEELAVKASIYVYYFLAIGVTFQLRGYLTRARLQEREMGKIMLPKQQLVGVQASSGLSQRMFAGGEQSISISRYRIKQRARRRRKMRRRMLAVIILSSLAGIVTIGIFLMDKAVK